MEKACTFLGNMHRFWLFGVFGQKGVLDFVSYRIVLAVILNWIWKTLFLHLFLYRRIPDKNFVLSYFCISPLLINISLLIKENPFILYGLIHFHKIGRFANWYSSHIILESLLLHPMLLLAPWGSYLFL